MVKKKTLVSGIQPSGKLHIGNYFGAMKQFVDYQDTYDSYIFVANYHALTTMKNPEELRQNTRDVVLDHLAVGLDPDKATLYLQTDIPERTELTWIFNCLLTVPYLERSVSWKDALAGNKDKNVGILDYPVLQAADILLPGADVVPVGQDQKQHIEIARDIAQKFNATYGQTFKVPEALIKKEVAVVPGIDGRKMSKSYNNDIKLFDSDENIRGQVMKIVTDSTSVGEPLNPEEDNVFALHKLFSADQLEDIKKRYVAGSIGHRQSKELLAENIIAFVTPLRIRRAELEKDPDYIDKVLKTGREKAHQRESTKMAEIRERVGLI